jgi:hypothetical protein
MKRSDNIRRRFIVAESDSIVVETTQTVAEEGLSPEGRAPLSRLRILKLKGTWRANNYNELCFEATGRKGPRETFTFKGSWKLNNNQRIEYISEDGRDTLIFKGYWKLSSANRILYFLEGSSTSRFEFKVQLESPVIYPKKGQICYRIGIGIRQSRLTLPGQMLILYGEWKFGRNLGLTFQMDYGKGNLKAIEFVAEVTFGRDNVQFALKNEFGEPLGLTLSITHKFLKTLDVKAFIRLKKRQDQHGIEAGVTIPF